MQALRVEENHRHLLLSYRVQNFVNMIAFSFDVHKFEDIRHEMVFDESRDENFCSTL